MRTIWTLVFSLPFLAASAQAYRPFPEGNTQWVEWHTQLNCCGPGSNTTECVRTIYFGPDTVIAGTTYHELRYDEQCDVYYIFGPWPPSAYSNWNMHLAFVRQDSMARKVYAYIAWMGGDTLLYDFSIGIGTYPSTAINWDYPNMEVTAIDSVLLGDGWHERWILNATDFMGTPYVVIEGIGSTFGVYGPMWPPFEWSDDLACFINDTVPIYSWADAPPGVGCDLSVPTNDAMTGNGAITLHPNPFEHTLIITLPTTMDHASYRLFALDGSWVASGSMSGSAAIAPTVRPGCYMLEVLDGAGRSIAREKAIKL